MNFKIVTGYDLRDIKTRKLKGKILKFPENNKHFIDIIYDVIWTIELNYNNEEDLIILTYSDKYIECFQELTNFLKLKDKVKYYFYSNGEFKEVNEKDMYMVYNSLGFGYDFVNSVTATNIINYSDDNRKINEDYSSCNDPDGGSYVGKLSQLIDATDYLTDWSKLSNELYDKVNED